MFYNWYVMKIVHHLSRANLTAHLRELARGQPAGMRRASDNTLYFYVIFIKAVQDYYVDIIHRSLKNIIGKLLRV